MFTFLHFTPDRPGRALSVTLDMNPNDIIASNDTTKRMVSEAKKAKRKFCAIYREHVGTTFFTYDAANQAQIEVQLLTLLSAPHTEVNVPAQTGGIESWSNY